MTPKQIAGAVAALALAIVIGLSAHAYISARVNLAKLDAIQNEVKLANDKAEAVQKQAEQDRLTREKQDAEREKQLALTLTAIARQKQQPATAEQVAQMVADRIPQTQVTKEQFQQFLEQLPDAPNVVKAGRDYMLDCDSCTVERNSLREDVKSKTAQLADLKTEKAQVEEQKAGVERERDAAIVAAKGGTKFQRVVRAMKYIGIGAVIGTATGVAISHR